MLGLEHSAMHLHPGRAAHNEASPVLCAWLASGRVLQSTQGAARASMSHAAGEGGGPHVIRAGP